ncbi:hypothetical protein [Sodaliphilus sp.]|uniref:hypothetical protein n=1 Tax=Sodaliphilus sp. TaxID=2815818 RepID=UPI00388F6429
MSKLTNDNTATTADVVTPEQWNGYTMDELKRRRIVAMVRRELGREKIAMQFAHTKNAMSVNGIKGLLFTDNELTKLKAMDYALLGWKAVKMFIKFRNRKRN